jgi:hypothetical protein
MATALSEWLRRGTLRGPDGAKGWSALVLSATAQRAAPGRIAGRNDTSRIEKTKLLRVKDSQRRREVEQIAVRVQRDSRCPKNRWLIS